MEKPCGKAHRQPVKEEKQTTQKSETRALYVPENRAENRAFGPKLRQKFHFIDKRKKAFYNQIIGVPFAKKTNGWDASARNSPRIWTEVCFAYDQKISVCAFCAVPLGEGFWPASTPKTAAMLFSHGFGQMRRAKHR